MLLAERGGVCSMLNTAADGSVQTALSKRETLSCRLAEMFRYGDSGMWGWMDSMFGQLKAIILTVVTALIAAIALLGLC